MQQNFKKCNVRGAQIHLSQNAHVCKSLKAAPKPQGLPRGSDICHQMEVWKSRLTSSMLRLNAGTCPEAAYGAIEKCVKIRQKNYICLEITAKCMWTIVDHCGPCVCFDWKVRFPVTHLPWLECNHWLDHMVNSNAYNQNGRNSQVLQCLNWNWFWLIGEYLGSEQVAAVVQYTDHARSWKNLHIHADFILVVFF